MSYGMDDIWSLHAEKIHKKELEDQEKEKIRMKQIEKLEREVMELESQIKEKEIEYMNNEKDYIYGMPREELIEKIQKEFFLNMKNSSTKPDEESVRMWQARSDEAMNLFGLLKKKPDEFIEKEEMEL